MPTIGAIGLASGTSTTVAAATVVIAAPGLLVGTFARGGVIDSLVRTGAVGASMTRRTVNGTLR